jgi:hypothetical protein
MLKHGDLRCPGDDHPPPTRLYCLSQVRTHIRAGRSCGKEEWKGRLGIQERFDKVLDQLGPLRRPACRAQAISCGIRLGSTDGNEAHLIKAAECFPYFASAPSRKVMISLSSVEYAVRVLGLFSFHDSIDICGLLPPSQQLAYFERSVCTRRGIVVCHATSPSSQSHTAPSPERPA